MAKISVNSQEAALDKDDLDKCRTALIDAKDQLNIMKPHLVQNWKGNSAGQCLNLLNDFIKQIDDLIGRTARTQNILDTIVNTYREADSKLSGGFGSW